MARKKHNRSSQKIKQRNGCNCTLIKVGLDRKISEKSLNDMNGNVDTDDDHTKSVNKINVKNKNTQSSKKNISYPVLPKSHRNKKSGNKSIISLYRKHRKKRSRNEERNMQLSSLISPTLLKPKLNHLIYQFGTGDICAGGPCREAEQYAKLHKLRETSINTNAKYLTKTTKQEHVCKCKEQDNAKIEVHKDKKSDKTPKKINKKVNVKTKQFTKSIQDKNECKCALDKPDNDAITSSKHAEENKKLIEQKILCKCKLEDKVDEIPQKPPKRVTKMNKKTKNVNMGDGDQILDKTKPKDKISTYTCECKLNNVKDLQNVNAGDQTGEPFFEMKVDNRNMNVLNADEIKYKVKSFGKLQSRRFCICPSRRSVCERGVCEEAMKNKQTNFNCKCISNNNVDGVIECTDKICDSKRIFKRMKIGNIFQSTNNSKPLFEVKLDPGNMNIVNTAEIRDIFEKSSHGVCPTGICSNRSKHNQIKCKCINKKIIPKTMECAGKTCHPRKKCNLFYLCSRVFSRCENWSITDYYKNIHISNYDKRYANENKFIKEKTKSRPEIHRRNGLKINFSKDRNKKHKDAAVLKPRQHVLDIAKKVEKDMKNDKNDKNDRKDKKNKKVKKKKKETKKSKGDIVDVFHGIQHKPNASYFQKFIVQCLKRKRKRCENRMKEEEKALEKAEKRAIKENRKQLRQQKKLMKEEELQWNCLTKFISGLINLIVGITKNVIKAMFSLVFFPIRSLIYIKRRLNDPNGTIATFNNWIKKTWGKRSNLLSRKVKEIGALNILADHFEDTGIYDALFANKGRTKEERAIYEAKRRKRKQRMQQRNNEARFGCRNILLTTLRKTPCICCYYICPDLYPACLSLIGFLKNFFNVLIYLLAFICWTPCILSFEVCRACVCCFFCTG